MTVFFQKNISGFSQTQQLMILVFYYLDNMLLSIDHLQIIFTKLGIRRM
jgi:hypothetical protein